MQVQVSGKHIAVGDSLRTRVIDEISNSIGKFFERGGDAEVTVSRDGHSFRVDCDVRLASGQHLYAHGLAGDAHAAFDQALSKIETRIKRYKHKLKDHSPQANAKQSELASYYVLRAPEEGAEQDGEVQQNEDGDGAPASMVIAETDREIRTMTVSMAVMELDLTESQTIVFRNAAHGGFSVVYRRPDGNIGWIDPERTRPENGSKDGNGAA